MNAEQIAKGLTKAQREGLLRRPCPSWWSGGPACMPPRERTGFALKARGLCVGSGTTAWPLTPLGLAVRAILLRDQGKG